HRFEARIKQRADVKLARLEARQNLFGDVFGIDEAELANRAQVDVLDDVLLEGAAELLVALAADAENLDLFALVEQRQRTLARQTHDRGIEGSGQATFAGADQQEMYLVPAGAGQQRRGTGRTCRGRRDIRNHRVHFLGVGPRRFSSGLRTAQL